MSILREKLAPERLKSMVDEVTWYHTFDFGDGLHSFGTYDNAPTVPFYGFPENLKNKHALDVGSSDGFFSFEMEKRGADVLAIDPRKYDGSLVAEVSPVRRALHEKKHGQDAEFAEKYQDVRELLEMEVGLNRFLIAKDLLNSSVNFQHGSIYELQQMNEKFDLVLCGDVMEHLKNPLLAIENLVAVTGGLCIIALSGALPERQKPTLQERLVYRMARTLGVEIKQEDPKTLVNYMGNSPSGGQFFRFHPLCFREACLASGFKKVEIHSTFELPNQRYPDVISHHVIFHCYA